MVRGLETKIRTEQGGLERHALAHQEEPYRKELWKDAKQLGENGDLTQMYEKSPDHRGEAD